MSLVLTKKILFVDDEANLLASMKRQFRKDFLVETALGGKEALVIARNLGPFTVVVSDMQMPGMNGIEFLKAMKALSPDTVGLMLTGRADLQMALEAVNNGKIFRILTKPCPPEQLQATIDAAVDQHALLTAERVLLQRTLLGGISVMFQIMTITVPVAFGRANLVRDWVRKLPPGLVENAWQLEIAAMLAPVGMMMIPAEILASVENCAELAEDTREIYAHCPEAAYDLIIKIPRLEAIANIVLMQNKGFDGSGFPPDGPQGKDIPKHARILKILQDLSKAGTTPSPAAFATLDAHPEAYDPDLLEAIRESLITQPTESLTQMGTFEVTLAFLAVNDVLAANLELKDGRLILAAGTRISKSMLSRLLHLNKAFSIKEPIKIQSRQLPQVLKAEEPESTAMSQDEVDMLCRSAASSHNRAEDTA